MPIVQFNGTIPASLVSELDVAGVALKIGVPTLVSSGVATQLAAGDNPSLFSVATIPSLTVQAVATANVALTGIPAPSTTDGVTLTAGQTVLLTAQTTASQNGPWVVASGAWARPAGTFAAGASITATQGAVVTTGTLYGGKGWLLPVVSTITVDTTAQAWAPLIPAPPVAPTGFAFDATVVHLGATETITGPKTLSVAPAFTDPDAAKWNLAVQVFTAKAAATSNLALSGLAAVDGFTPSATGTNGGPDIILATGQTDPTKNGLWAVSSGAWARSSRFPAGGVIARSCEVTIGGGSSPGTVWVLPVTTPVTIDTTAQSWVLQPVTVGALPASVALKTTSGTWSANQEFDNPIGVGGAPLGAQPLTISNPLASGWTADVVGKVNSLLVRHGTDLLGAGGDCMDIFHKSTGDGLYVQHDGGQVPASTFTATTTSGSATLTLLSATAGLVKGTPITGAGIPGGTTLAANVNVGAATVLMSNPASASAAGVTISIAATGVGGGDAALNVLIPYHADSHGTGRDGTIVSTRQGMQGLFIQNQQTTAGNGAAGGNSIYVEHYTAVPAVQILNQFTGNPAAGNGPALVITDYSTVSAISISKQTAPAAGSAAFALNSPLAGPIDMIRVNDNTGVGRFVVRNDGTLAIGSLYPTAALFAVRAQVNMNAAGVQRNMGLLNSGAGGVSANGDGVQIEFDSGSTQYGLLSTVFDSIAGGNASMRFSVRAANALTERLRLDGTGIGFYGHAPVAQPAAPVTLADVIAVIADAA